MHAKIFDIDGTLLQSAAVDDRIYMRAIERVLGKVRIRESLHDYDHVSDSGILTQLLEDNGLHEQSGLYEKMKATFVAAISEHIETNGPFVEIPGARKHFMGLAGTSDCAVAIATGGWRESALLKLQSAGFDLQGIPLATSDDAKDRRDIMMVALEQLGSNFQSITYYGDGPWDQEATAALGWQFVPVGAALGGLLAYPDNEET